MIPDSVTHVHGTAFARCAELQRQATEAGLSVEEWGRSNWRAQQLQLETRFTIVSTVTNLNRLTESGERIALVEAPDADPQVAAGLRLLVELGGMEEGLLRMIVKFAA